MNDYAHGREHEALDNRHNDLAALVHAHLAAHDFALPEHTHAEHALTEHVHESADDIVPALIDLADEAGESVEVEATATAEEVEPPKEEPSTPELETAPLRIHPLNRRVVGRRE